MTTPFTLLESELSCSICFSIFREPVVLRCCHSFCRACLENYWGHCDPSARQCPLCRRVAPLTEEPVLNLTLKNLCDSYLQKGEGQGSSREGLGRDPQCSLHGEPFKLFCLEDKVPICVVCQSSKAHKNHECSPIGEAVLECKEVLRAALGALRGKWEASEKVKQTFEEEVVHTMNQVLHTETLIRAEFEKLHAFLQAEEAARMAVLKKEGKAKARNLNNQIKEMTRSMLSLSHSITVIEEELRADDLTILQNYKTTEKSTQCTTQEPVVLSGALVNVASHLDSLKYRVWKKMLGTVQYHPVILDPNSAAPWLVLSKDLTSVCKGNERQRLPNNPERFSLDAAVLGACSFRSGEHWWDVEVGDSSTWVVGVAKESASRKEKQSSIFKNGYLTVYYYKNMYFAGTSPPTRLVLTKKPCVVRVQLNCDRGRVVFSDPSDNTLIYTFKHTLTEEVFPYLWVGCKEHPLRLLPVSVSITQGQVSSARSWF
ncbi:E3 ubiquitin-protein ligase TRIM35-like [Brienomyrus brachyistius]|uniref:E3 ubiquitin-protein ligase TRIM35-like n=1 Tax=Brienomyrus brachyistius TaxID=42636 RepID=UPI0020B2AFCE|nr:E3 ubiquitin-protein ligase TRIM35-like [Brienomyrus brachyistius]